MNFKEQAIQDVAAARGYMLTDVVKALHKNPEGAMEYLVAQRRRVLELEAALTKIVERTFDMHAEVLARAALEGK